jgi:hypothetical protein
MKQRIIEPQLIIGFLLWLMAVAISYFYFVQIPKIVNIEKHRPEIEKAIKEKVDAKIKLGPLETVMSYDFGINLKTKWVKIEH